MSGSLTDLIKKQDRFGQKIEMNLSGEKSVNSVCGAMCTVVQGIVFLGALATVILKLFFVQQFTISKSDYLLAEPLDIVPTLENMVFEFEYKNGPIDMNDNEYVYLESQDESAEVQECSEQKSDTSTSYCLNAKSLKNDFKLSMKLCNNDRLRKIGSTKFCQDEFSARNWVKHLTLTVSYKKPHIDLSETQPEIFYSQKVLVKKTMFDLVPNIEQIDSVNIKRHSVELSDSILGFFMPPTIIEYQSVENGIRQSIYNSDENPALFSVSFEVDRDGQKTFRRLWNLGDALGWFGGIIMCISWFFQMMLQPFFKNNLAIAVCETQDESKDLEISSLTFYWKLLLKDVGCFDCFFDDKFSKSQMSFYKDTQEQLVTQLSLKPLHKFNSNLRQKILYEEMFIDPRSRQKIQDKIDNELKINIASEKFDDSGPTINFDHNCEPIQSKFASSSPPTPAQNKLIRMKTYQNPYMKRKHVESQQEMVSGYIDFHQRDKKYRTNY